MSWSMACWPFYLSFGTFLNDLDFYMLALRSLEDAYAIEKRLSIPGTRDRLVHKVLICKLFSSKSQAISFSKSRALKTAVGTINPLHDCSQLLGGSFTIDVSAATIVSGISKLPSRRLVTTTLPRTTNFTSHPAIQQGCM